MIDEILEKIKSEMNMYLELECYTDDKFVTNMMKHVVSFAASISETIELKHAKLKCDPLKRNIETAIAVNKYKTIKRVDNDLNRAGITKDSLGRNLLITVCDKQLKGSYDEVVNKLCEIYPKYKKCVISSAIASAAKKADFSKCLTTLSTAHSKETLVLAIQDYTNTSMDIYIDELKGILDKK
jgi:hypothetical protein